jgi:hypothetical protein
VKLALLKSVLTGTFIDIRFYVFNRISDNLPPDLTSVFTLNIVIEEWGPVIAICKWEVLSQFTQLYVTKEVVGIDSEAMCLVDVLLDDYESWNGEHPVEFRRDKMILYMDHLQIYQGGRCLMHFQVEVAHFLRIHKQDDLCAPSESDS